LEFGSNAARHQGKPVKLMIVGHPFVRQQTTNTNSGIGPFVLAPPASGDLGYSVFSNGTVALCTRRDSSNAFESGDVSVNTVAGVTTLTWVTRGKTSNGGSTPVSWGAGAVQTVDCCVSSDSYVHARNYGEEYSGHGDAFLGNVGGAPDGIRGLSGGSDGRVVRYTSSNTVTNAQNTDSLDQLTGLLFRNGGKYYRPGDVVPSLSGLTAGQVLYLGDNSTPLTATAPVVSGTVRQLRLGICLSTTTFLFTPQPPNVTLELIATGGTNSTILRYSSAGVLVVASAVVGGGGVVSDTSAQLEYLFAKGSDGLIYRPGRLIPFSGVSAGVIYFLGASGALVTTPINTPDSTKSVVMIGLGWATGVLLFDPKRPVCGTLGLGVPFTFKLEQGFFRG
jgi:hypothetical protein